MEEKSLEGGTLRDKKVKTGLDLEILDLTANTLREVLKLVIEGADVEDLGLAEMKAKELYRTALNVWAKLKERQLMKTYEASRVKTT